MMDQAAIVRALQARGVLQADVCRVLDLPSSRISEMYAGRRLMKLDEAIKLIAAFDLDGGDYAAAQTPSAAVLFALIKAVLARSRKENAANATASLLAAPLEYGLALVARHPGAKTNAEVLAIAAEAAADRVHSLSASHRLTAKNEGH